MINWLHKWWNPHCPDCREQEHEDKICASCETLKTENARLSSENLRLIEVLLRKSGTPEEITTTEPIRPLPVTNKHVPWNVRRQMLEAEDKAKAKLVANNPILSTTDPLTGKVSTETLSSINPYNEPLPNVGNRIDTDDLEQELMKGPV